MSETILSRFLRYVRVDTQSDARSETCPSTPGQWTLQKLLRSELKRMGVRDVQLTEHGYVIAKFPATPGAASAPRLAFFAHVDTAPDFSGKNVQPIVHRNYNGQPLRFPANPSLVLDQAIAPDLAAAKGKDLVTASGDTLLGADDKAGVAVLMTLAAALSKNPRLPHGELRICFNPDEEIGKGVNRLALRQLDAEVGYTLDGGPVGEICWETFSGDAAVVTIEGVSTHPGEARAKGMVHQPFPEAAIAVGQFHFFQKSRCPNVQHGHSLSARLIAQCTR